LGTGPYTVTPAKTTDINGITSFDAALVAQNVVGLIALTANQQLAADASNNGAITSFDAALIAQTAIDIPNVGVAGTWRFVPASRTYANTLTDQSSQNYEAILIGEVSGNWKPPSGGEPFVFPDARAASLPIISVALPNRVGLPGTLITIPISVDDLAPFSIISYQFAVTFDPTVLQPQSSAMSSVGTLSSGMTITANSAIPGRLKVAAFGTAPLSGSGTFLNLNFTVVGTPGASTPLVFQSFLFNEGNPEAQTSNGQFTISAPTAAAASINGRDYRQRRRGAGRGRDAVGRRAVAQDDH
jgi:hypothetical protein